jgi:hypothetical protein
MNDFAGEIGICPSRMFRGNGESLFSKHIFPFILISGFESIFRDFDLRLPFVPAVANEVSNFYAL